MGRMITNAEDLLDEGGHPAACPYLADEAVVFRPLGQEVWESGQLIPIQAGCSSRGRTLAKSLDAPFFSGPLEPLAHGSPSYAQGSGDIDLLPALFLQLEGSHPPAFLPGLGFGCGAHVPWWSKSSSMFTDLQSSQ